MPSQKCRGRRHTAKGGHDHRTARPHARGVAQERLPLQHGYHCSNHCPRTGCPHTTAPQQSLKAEVLEFESENGSVQGS